MTRRCHRIGMAIDKDAAAALTSEFSHEVEELGKEIAGYIPPDHLHRFSQIGLSEEEKDNGSSSSLSSPADTEVAASEEELAENGFNPGSPEQIGVLLWEVLRVGEGMDLKRTGQGMISTGKRQLETVRLRHPVVPKILRYRELKRLINAYTRTLPKLARFHPRGPCCPICELEHRSESWRVHGEMGTTRAATGRINHLRPNLGNIPTRTDDGQRVQALFIAPQGYRLVARDLSQIELRDLAHLANATSMINVYLEGGDIHDHTARKVFRLGEDEKPDKIKHRMASKRVNFGIQNGTTEIGLYLQLVMDYGVNGLEVPEWLTREWCKWFIAEWLATYEEVGRYFALQWYRGRRYRKAWDAFGRCRPVPEVVSTHGWIKQQGLRQAQNLPVTSTAAGQLKLVMGASDLFLRRMMEGGVWCWPLVTIHDALIAEVEEDGAEAVDEGLGKCFDECMNDVDTGELLFRVPMGSDGKVMEKWEK